MPALLRSATGGRVLDVEQFPIPLGDIKLLSRQGHSIRDIARRTGHARNTVRRMLRSDAAPTFAVPDRPRSLDPFKPYLTKRFDEHGLSACQLAPKTDPPPSIES